MNFDVADIRAFRHSLRALEREISLSLERETNCCGVTSAQCHFLLETEERPNVSLTDLSEALSLDVSTLSRTADGLHETGFIRRETDPTNRRKVSIRLTDEGKTKAGSINDLCDDSTRRLFSYVPAEKRGGVAEAIGILADAMKRKRNEEKEPCCSFSILKKTKVKP